MLALATLLSACSKPRVAHLKAGAKDDADLPQAQVAMGSAEIFSRDPMTHALKYTVRWKSGVVKATDPAHYEGVGNMKGVSGVLYRRGSPVADFSADEGAADTAKGTITLQGHVKVISVDGSSKLAGTTVRSDQLHYATADEIIKVLGNVSVSNRGSEFGPIAEAWCSSDLKQVATPSLFVPVRHNQPTKLRP